MEQQQQRQGFALDVQQGRALWHLDALLVFKALGEETGGQFWAIEGLADRRMAVPLHAHSRDDEFWYVLEGEFAFTMGDETRTLGPGAFVYIPRDVPHSFRVSSETARWLGIGLPGGFDRWFFETGEPAKELALPPPSSAPPDVGALIASLQAYDTEVLGPPPGM